VSAERLTPFRDYARYYDLLYGDKDYVVECDFVVRLFEAFSCVKVKSVLDVGCGTGQHAIVLGRRGYRVTGIDASSTVIELARAKAGQEGVDLRAIVADVREFNVQERFDACVAMFAVMNYLRRNEDLTKAIKQIRTHLVEGSLFIFDCWNGLAVLRQLPSVRVKRIAEGGRVLVRIAEPELDAVNHLCTVNYRLIVSEGRNIIDEIEESHIMRFLFPQEVVHYLEDSGFEVLKICPFLDMDGDIDENVWNMAVVARAVKTRT